MSKELAQQQKAADLSRCHHALRTAFGTFVTGVATITTLNESGRLCGPTANSFASVPLDPPLLLACIAKSREGHDIFAATEGPPPAYAGGRYRALQQPTSPPQPA